MISYVNIALFTETWLGDSIIENHLHISGYHLTARNRTTGPHDGVGLYIKNNPRFKSLEYLQDPDFETMWTRGFSRPDYRVESLVGLLALSTTDSYA